jgi:DNA-binding response OmpR family regulator
MVSDAAPGSPPGRILVADDEPHIRRILCTLLRNARYEVDEAVDGREALDRVDSEALYDFILLDLMMPEASGLEVLKSIREHERRWDTPVIILTAKGQDTDRQEALKAGADDFLTKPFSPKKLLARIREILAAH